MIENLECRRFRNRLDAYVDGELSASEREEMRRHAQECESCGKILEDLEETLKLLTTLDEGVEIPAEAARSWRRVIQEEAEIDRKRSGRGWVRALGSLAAAFVLLLTLTGVYRNYFDPDMLLGGMRDYNTNGYVATEENYSTYYANDYDSGLGETAYTTGMTKGARSASATLLAQDGALDDALLTTRQELESRKPVVIRTATRAMQSLAFDEDMTAIDSVVELYNGWFGYRTLSGKSWADGGDGRRLELSIRIPTESMDDFLTDLSQIGVTIRMTDSSEDVSSRYYDTQARVDGLKAQQQRLLDLIGGAESLSDLIELEDKLYEVQSEIDSLEGALRDIASRASYSQVTVTLNEVREYTEPEKVDITLAERIQKGFRDSIEWVKSFCQDMLVAVVTFSPALVVIIPAVLLVILVIRSIRRRRQRKHR